MNNPMLLPDEVQHPFPDFLWKKMKNTAPEGPYYDDFPFDPIWLLWGLSIKETEQGKDFWTAIHHLYLAGDPSEIDVLRVFGEYGIGMY